MVSVGRRLPGAAAAMLLGALVSGCGAAEEQLSESLAEEAMEQAAEAGASGGADVELDSDSGEVTIENEDGTDTFSMGSGDLPESFPDDVPLPPGDFTVTMASALGSGGFIQVYLDASGTVDEVFEHVSTGLEEAGYAVERTQEQTAGGETNRTVATVGHGRRVSVAVSDAPTDAAGGVAVSYTIMAEKEGSS